MVTRRTCRLGSITSSITVVRGSFKESLIFRSHLLMERLVFGWGILKRFGFVLVVRVIIRKVPWRITKEMVAHGAEGLL